MRFLHALGALAAVTAGLTGCVSVPVVIVHSKAMVVDSVWSLVGSSNFDQRSVLFNDEVDVVVLGDSTAEQIRAYMRSDMRHARRIDWRFVHRQGIGQHLKALFWRLWRRLF